MEVVWCHGVVKAVIVPYGSVSGLVPWVGGVGVDVGVGVGKGSGYCQTKQRSCQMPAHICNVAALRAFTQQSTTAFSTDVARKERVTTINSHVG